MTSLQNGSWTTSHRLIDGWLMARATKQLKTVGKNPERAKFALQDVNGDGLQDMVVEIDTKGFDGVDGDTEEMNLTGDTNGGTQFLGKDAVDITQFMCVRSLE